MLSRGYLSIKEALWESFSIIYHIISFKLQKTTLCAVFQNAKSAKKWSLFLYLQRAENSKNFSST